MDKIPTHDPQTGDTNPYYKELTGEENPYPVLQIGNRFNVANVLL